MGTTRTAATDAAVTSIETATSLVLLDAISRSAAVDAVLDHARRGVSSVVLQVPVGRASRSIVDAAAHERLLTGPSVDAGYVIGHWRLSPLVAELRAAGLDVVADVCPPTALPVCRQVVQRTPISAVVLVGHGRAWSRRGTPAVARQLRRHLDVPVLEVAGRAVAGPTRQPATHGRGRAWRHAPAG